MNAYQFLEDLFSVEMFAGWTGELTFEVEGKEVQVHLLQEDHYRQMHVGFYFDPKTLFELKMQYGNSLSVILLRNRKNKEEALFSQEHKYETLFSHHCNSQTVELHMLSEAFLRKFQNKIAPGLRKPLNDLSFERKKVEEDASAKAAKEREECTHRRLKALGL